MSVQELSLLHRRYVDLSDRFRSIWAFQQFLQSMGKVYPEAHVGSDSPQYQNIYRELKDICDNLGTADADPVRARLDNIEERLSSLSGPLLEQDSKVSPDGLRLFFLRVKEVDEKILTQLVKFYFYTYGGGKWDTDRQDKVDFLLTHLASTVRGGTGDTTIGDRNRVREILDALWRILDVKAPDPKALEKHQRAMEEIQNEASKVKSLDELADRQAIPRYRSLKHGLGPLFFHPEILRTIIQTNHTIKLVIRERYRADERRIITEYQRIFDLEREVVVDEQLQQEINALRGDVEQFEKRLQTEGVRLDELARVRRRVRTLLPRLTGASEATEVAPREAKGPKPVAGVDGESGELLGDYRDRIVAALEGISSEVSPKAACLTPEVFPFRLESREVVAYRRLKNGDDCDPTRENFLLDAAALRVRVAEEAEEINGLLDGSSMTGEGEIFARARLTTHLADLFLWRFHHLIDHVILGGEFTEVHHLQLLRMRLMRCYSGLWLLAYKPILFHQAGSSE
jgi:hypothetical protein